VQENFITDDTEEIGAEASQELNAFIAETSKKAHRFDGLKLPPEMARKKLLLKLSTTFPAPADRKEQKELGAAAGFAEWGLRKRKVVYGWVGRGMPGHNRD